MKHLTVVIPSRSQRPSRKTLDTLEQQTFKDFITVVQPDCGRGANWARNRGFELCRTEFVLFSDDDIEWLPDAFSRMIDVLDADKNVAYSYGTYLTMVKGVQHVISEKQFNADALRRNNFVSTMSIMRSRLFPGFDESFKRLQDWDLWLTLLEQGYVGKHCGYTIFKTVTAQDGVTFGSIPWKDAYAAIRKKHPNA